MPIPQIPNLINFAIPVFVILIVTEIIISARMHLKTYKFKDAATSISMGLGNVFIGIISKGMVYAILYYIYTNYRLFDIPFTWYY